MDHLPIHLQKYIKDDQEDCLPETVFENKINTKKPKKHHLVRENPFASVY